MRRICAWCQDPLNDEPDDGHPISHGICERCAGYAHADRKSIESFLKTIEAPVLAIDRDVRVIATNAPALFALKKDQTEVADRLAGEVIE